jgi:hypothetical protein
MKKKYMTTLICVFFIALMALVAYAKQEETGAQPTIASAIKNSEKNMTFGNCVSEAAGIKNTCYAAVKDAYTSCKNTPADKPVLKECKATYKKDMKQCKTDFKAGKKECGKIKHSFMDSIKTSFK